MQLRLDRSFKWVWFYKSLLYTTHHSLVLAFVLILQVHTFTHRQRWGHTTRQDPNGTSLLKMGHALTVRNRWEEKLLGFYFKTTLWPYIQFREDCVWVHRNARHKCREHRLPLVKWRRHWFTLVLTWRGVFTGRISPLWQLVFLHNWYALVQLWQGIFTLLVMQ